MKSSRRWFLCTSVWVAVPATVLMQAQSKPVVTSELIVDYMAPPETLELAVAAADAIVVAVSETERTYEVPIPGASTRLIYTVKIKEILRSHPALTVPGLQVYRLGGDTDRGDHILRTIERGFPGFLSGRTYLLLLSWNRVLSGFEPRFGPNGVFELFPDGRVETPGNASFARLQTTKSGAKLLRDIRRALPER